MWWTARRSAKAAVSSARLAPPGSRRRSWYTRVGRPTTQCAPRTASAAAQRRRTTPRTETRQHPVRPPEADAEACWTDVPRVDAPRRADNVSEAAAISARRAATRRRRRARRTWRCSSCAASRRRRPPGALKGCDAALPCVGRPAAARTDGLFASEDSRIGLPEPGEVADTQRVDLLLHRGEAVVRVVGGGLGALPAASHTSSCCRYRRQAPRRALPRVVARRVRAQDPRHDAAEQRMQRLLRATGCVEMNRRYGFEEATELFHARLIGLMEHRAGRVDGIRAGSTVLENTCMFPRSRAEAFACFCA